jgi:hypothetical protein
MATHDTLQSMSIEAIEPATLEDWDAGMELFYVRAPWSTLCCSRASSKVT